MCHMGDTEIGGFGISHPDYPLFIKDFVLVKQTAGSASVAFDDDGVADFFDECVDAGLQPRQFARVWIHTHPCSNVTPSMTDEDTFQRVFGNCDWAVMFIAGREENTTYCRLRLNAGPGASVKLDVNVDWSDLPTDAARVDASKWREEYVAKVSREVWQPPAASYLPQATRYHNGRGHYDNYGMDRNYGHPGYPRDPRDAHEAYVQQFSGSADPYDFDTEWCSNCTELFDIIDLDKDTGLCEACLVMYGKAGAVLGETNKTVDGLAHVDKEEEAKWREYCEAWDEYEKERNQETQEGGRSENQLRSAIDEFSRNGGVHP